jgi:hypothetical protein
MFEDLGIAKRKKYQWALGAAQAQVENAPVPAESDLRDCIFYAASYTLMAFRLHVGMSPLWGQPGELVVFSEEDQLVLDDPILRAWVVGSACSDMIAELELQRDIESAFPDYDSSVFEAELTDLKNLRYHAAWTIADGDNELAVALLPQFSSHS